MVLLGIDLGTSALKAILVGGEENVLAAATITLRSEAPRPGWSEQDPLDWWRALEAALAQLRAAEGNALADVRAIGLSGQMHGAVLLERDGTPVRPAILWNDGRATAECKALESRVPELASIAGVAAMPGFTAPKLLWLKEHEPECFSRIHKVVSPKDYLRLRLTGEWATDMSDAAGTLWLDEARRDWSDAVLAATGLSRNEMPRLIEGSAPSGVLTGSVASALGIKARAIVAGGAGDAAAAAIGIGAVEDRDAFFSLGTSAQFFVTDDRYRPHPGTLLHAFAHALPDRWFSMAAMLNGASCLDLLTRLTGNPVPAMIDAAEKHYSGPSRLLFLPYLSGERTPHNDPMARGAFVGLDHDCSAIELTQAVLEGVAFSLLEARALLELAGVRFTSVAAVGGGARSRFWMQLIAHVVGLPIVRYRGSETGPAFGAARLARIALSAETAQFACAKPPVLDELLPDTSLSADYRQRFENYRALYQDLKRDFSPVAPFIPGSP